VAEGRCPWEFQIGAFPLWRTFAWAPPPLSSGSAGRRGAYLAHARTARLTSPSHEPHSEHRSFGYRSAQRQRRSGQASLEAAPGLPSRARAPSRGRALFNRIGSSLNARGTVTPGHAGFEQGSSSSTARGFAGTRPVVRCNLSVQRTRFARR